MNLEGYEVGATIARSARTIVRRARRLRDGAPVVIKSLSRDYPAAHELAQLEFEHRILRKLDGAGIPRALDLVRQGNTLAMIVADFGGDNLPSCVGGDDSFDVFFTIATAVTSTLDAVHRQGVIHKDIKPRNILMNPTTREVKLIDFNSAIELSREHQDGTLAGRFEGSLPYMSPEQTGRMNRDLDYRSDYYSLGVTFFELLTGTLPFSATDVMGWVHCHISKQPPDPRVLRPAIPEPLAEIIRRLLAKNPEDRYQSARGLLRDLERCQREWIDKRRIDPFQIGAHDVSDHFQVSQKLFGREREVATLLEAFDTASKGPARLLLVSGYSGIGKSSLIHEIQRAIVRLRGNFIAGKFDQLERNIPYKALLQALRAFVKHLLSEPEDSLTTWRKDLCAALGQNGQVMVDLIPELEQVIGRQPPVPDLNPHEARARMHRVFRELIKAMARADRPLVIFIDDLQWTDASTPELLVTLLGDEGLRHALFIGAYRDNEVKEGDLFSIALRQLDTERPAAISRIFLQPLPEESLRQLVADTLRCDPAKSAPLAALIFKKTAGNPFFANELLRMLHQEGSFQFHSEDGRWDWDYHKIEQASVSDNVVDLMIARLRRLSPQTLQHLCLAACLGSRFDLTTVARVAGVSAGVIAAALWEAVEEGILLPLGSGYRLVRNGAADDDSDLESIDVQYQFQHDRLQQAAYLLPDAQERTRLHLRIGRLLASLQGVEREGNVFDVVNHLNLGRDLIESSEERAQLSALNGVAGQRAKRAAAYSVAATYFETSLGLRSEGEWATDPQSHFECGRARAECLFFTGDVARAAATAEELVDRAPSKVARGSAVELKVTILEHQGRLLEAVDTIRHSLAAFGIELPEDHAEIDRRIGEGIAKMQAHLARVGVENLVSLPELGDPELCMAMNLLFQVIPSAIQTYPPLFILAELVMFDLALTHGVTAVSCKNFVDCGIIQGGILGDYETAYRLGKAAFAMLDRYAPTPLESGVNFVFAAFVSHWRAPAREGFEAFSRAVRVGLELGDPRHPPTTRVLVLQRMLLTGTDLDECQAEGARVMAHLTELHADNNVLGASAANRVVSRLLGESGPSHPADRFTASLVTHGNAQWLYSYGQAETMASVLLGDIPSAEAWQAFTAPFLAAGTGLFSIPDYHLSEALILARKCARESDEARHAALQTLVATQERLRIWAENSPANYLHKYKLCAAEVARVAHASTDDVLSLYDEAVAATGDGFLHLRALANERLADYWLEKRQPKIARPFLEDAYYLYGRWGARAKLRELERHYPDWLAHSSQQRTDDASVSTSDAARTGSLDLESIIKATQALSSEVKAERLFAKLMEAIIENAGAQRGCLILRDETTGALTVEARAAVQGTSADAGRSTSIEGHAELCPDIVRYVARTATAVVVDDATHDGAYGDDVYVQNNGIKSVLCVPVLTQGKLVAILYAENNAATHAFTSDRVSLLQVIASQAAISITNARLYDNLEEKVVERTRELAEKTRETAAMLDSMQQGIFTVADDLLIQPQYSAHLEHILDTKMIAGSDCLQLVFDGSNVSADAMDTMRCALQVSFGAPLFIAKVNAWHFVREFQRSGHSGGPCYFEVEWNLIADDDGIVYKVLVALRDVTFLKQLKDSVAANAHELEMVGQILDAGLEAFERFRNSTRGLLDENAALLRAEASLSLESLELMFRNMHTIKGNARLLGLGGLVDTVHAAEEPYAELRLAPHRAPDRMRLFASVDAVRAAIDAYEHVYRRKLGELARGPDARVNRALGEIRTALDEAARGTSGSERALRSIRHALQSAEAVPLSEVVKETARILPSLARELDKAAPVLDCEVEGVLLIPAWAQVMRDVLIHAFRNALDHGLESRSERQARGKSPEGRISVRVGRSDGRTAIHLSDDGRGLRLSALRERLNRATASDEEVASTIFLPGISTSTQVSSISGRGVGMDAIRSYVRRQGGEARIVLGAGASEDCRPFEVVLELPETAILAAPTRPEGRGERAATG
jgi:predicted ATPase/GAF domain-containing protein